MSSKVLIIGNGFVGSKLTEHLRMNNKFNNVMIFTHNNSCNKLIFDYGRILNLHVPTCGILIFDFDVYLWSEIISGKCNYYFPKTFK